MNFKTTIFLIALLIIAGITVYFVHQQPPAPTEPPSTTKNLVTISQDDVKTITVTPADGTPLTLEHDGPNWKITKPVQAKADTFSAGDLVREMCELQSHAQVSSDVATGVDYPFYRVEMLTKDGKTTKLSFGNKSDVGDNLYVRVNAEPKVEVVSADVQTYLDKTVNDYRDMNLVTATTDTVQRITIKSPANSLELSRDGGKWEIAQPQHWPTESSAMDDLLSTLTSLRAATFVDHPLPPAMYQFNRPQLVVSFWTTSSGSSATTQPTEKTIVFGGYDDVRKQNVFAQVDGQVVKIAASNMDSLNKSPLDLRDKNLVDIDPAKVTQVILQRNLPAATQPTSRPASKVDLVMVHPAKPKASTQPTTLPSAPWVFANNKSAQVNQANVNDVLSSLHPLRVEKYLNKLPSPLPSDHFRLIVQIPEKTYQSDATDLTWEGSPFDFYATPANDGNGIGSYNGTYFEVPNTFIDHLKLDFGWQNK